MQAPPQIKEIVGRNIRSARDALKLSRRAFGELVGVDQMLVYKWENGQHRPSDQNLAALAKATGHEIAWFYTDHHSLEPTA
jgi:transcriptional regulator with XRE-family HTH domain